MATEAQYIEIMKQAGLLKNSRFQQIKQELQNALEAHQEHQKD